MVDNEVPKEEEKEEKQKGNNERRKNLCKSRLLRSYAIDLDFTVVVEKEKWENYITDTKKGTVDDVKVIIRKRTQSHYVAQEGFRQILLLKNLHQSLFQS